MTIIQRFKTFSERIAKIETEAIGADLTSWEKERIKEWKQLNFGSPKQSGVINKIGQRLMGDAKWDEFVKS